LGSPHSALTSIPRLWTLYTKLKIGQHGELLQRPRGYGINGDDDDDDDDDVEVWTLSRVIRATVKRSFAIVYLNHRGG